MDVKIVEKNVKLLESSLHMRMDFNQFNEGEKKLLIVEGRTDEKFIKHYLQDDVICFIANKAFGTTITNYKDAIIKVVYGLSVLPAFIKCPPGSGKWKVYGLIDMDFDSSSDYTNTSKLFITDTHDLETLMISTDDTLLQRIAGCPITASEIKAALFLAYQLGKMRFAMRDQISVTPISAGKVAIDYSQFVLPEHKISLPLLVTYINSNSDKPLPSAKEKKLTGQLLKDKGIKKYLGSDGCWSREYDKFDPASISDFWETVNGHDILSLLKYLCKYAAIKFNNRKMHALDRLDREFEIALIDTYDQKNFKKTTVYSNMNREHIVN